MRRVATGPTFDPVDSGPDGTVSIGGLARRYVGVFLLLAPVYLLWRTTTVGSGWLLALSMPWLWSEAWSVVQILALRHEVTGGSRRSRTQAPDTASTGEHPVSSRDVEVAVVVSPSATAVDIERTIVGLQATAHLERVTILADEYRRQELIELSRYWAALAVQLVSIPGGLPRRTTDRLDVVLSHTELPWVLWIEAGQVPMPDMIEALDDRPIDGRVAVRQIAVGLLNPQSLVHVNRLGDDEALERRLIGPARGERGLAPWHGPGSLLRRAAFEGRSPVHDPGVSELSRYAVDLKRDGWAFDYEPRPLIRVPAADSLQPYLTERYHRSLAALEQLGLSWTRPGVSRTTRRAALAAAMSTTCGLRQLGILAILVACLIAGRLPVVADDASVLGVMAGFSVASMLARRALSAGTMGFGDWVRHGWRTLGADLAALTPRFAKPLRLVHPRLRIAHRGSLGRMQFLTLTFVVFEVALTIRALTTLYPILLPTMSRRDAAVLLVVSVGVTIGLLSVLGGLARDHGRRRNPRVQLETGITVAGSSGNTLDITPSGLGALVAAAPPVGATVPFDFTIAGHDGTEHRIAAAGTIRTATLHGSGSVRVGLEFDDIDIQDRMAITEYCALGLSDTPSFREANAGHLASEASYGQLAMVRVLAAMAVVAAGGAVMAGPRANPVSADSATTIPAVFTATVGGIDEDAALDDLTVRLHTDGWSEPLSVNSEGRFERGANPEAWEGPVHLEVVLGDDRHVEELPADATIRLAVADVGEAVSAAVVGPGGRWRSVAAGDPLVPGPYTVRWSVGDQEPRTAAVRVDGDQILQVRSGGVTVLSTPAAGSNATDSGGTDSNDGSPPSTSSSTSTSTSTSTSSSTSTSTSTSTATQSTPSSGANGGAGSSVDEGS